MQCVNLRSCSDRAENIILNMFNNLEMVLNIVNILLAQYFLNNVQYFDFNRGKKRQNRTF